MPRVLALLLLTAVALPIASCRDDDPPADVEGMYTIAITNGENACDLQNWMVGTMTTGIPLMITQDGGEIMGTVEGAAGVVITLLLGSADYDGTVSAHTFVLENYGTTTFRNGDCVATLKSIARGTIMGDVIMGTIEYTPVTNESPACMNVEACVSEQRFNGTRPPS